jgi:hypothetical protein
MNAIIGICNYYLVILSNPIVVAIIAIFLTYYYAFSGFRKQRIRDELCKTYLDSGVENLLYFLVENLNIMERNYANALFLVKEYRDNGPAHFKIHGEPQISNLLKSADASVPKSFYRTLILINIPLLQELLFHTFASFKTDNNLYMTETPNAIRKHLEDTSIPIDQFQKGIIDILGAARDEIGYIYELVMVLEGLNFRLRKLDLYRYEDIDNLKNDKHINMLLGKLSAIDSKRKQDMEKSVSKDKMRAEEKQQVVKA